MLSTRHGVRVLGIADLADFLRLAARDPVVNVFADYRARTTNLEPRWLGGEMWGRFSDGELTAACHVGANLVPVQATEDDARVFAERALTRGRTVSTVVGPQSAVRTLLERRGRGVGSPARAALGPAAHADRRRHRSIEPDPDVRRTTTHDMAQVYPACVAMYTEEVGISPEYGGGSELYRTRVSQLVGRGWSFARFDRGRLVFKAEVACASPYAAQVQGVWVPPDRRGEGIAGRGMAAVVELVRPTSRRSCPSTSTSTTVRRAVPTRRPASGRRRRSPRSCSDGPDTPYARAVTHAKDTLLLAGILAVSGTIHLVKPEVYKPLMPAFVPKHREVILAQRRRRARLRGRAAASRRPDALPAGPAPPCWSGCSPATSRWRTTRAAAATPGSRRSPTAGCPSSCR